MTFSKLAKYFENLEATSSRLALIDILVDLFKEVGKEEVGMVSYLLQGRVAPFYEPVELGMSEKLVAQAMARVYGVEREAVLKEYGKLGDLGLVAEKLSNHVIPAKAGIHTNKKSHGSSGPKSGMTVPEVFKVLTEIAKTSGDGTVEKKIALLSGLLGKMDGVSSKHLVRVPMGASRLGIGDPTILDAFAKLKLGDKGKRPLLEGAYNRVSDLGLIGETLWSKGIKGVQGLDVQVGRPIRSQLCERITDPKAILEKYGGVAHVQYKYDGFRVQIHLQRTSLRGPMESDRGNLSKEIDSSPSAQNDNTVVRLFSRNLEETTSMFPDIIAGILKQVKAKSIILDSEALAFNPESEEF